MFARLHSVLIIVRSDEGKIGNSSGRVTEIWCVESDDRNSLADGLAEQTIEGRGVRDRYHKPVRLHCDGPLEKLNVLFRAVFARTQILRFHMRVPLLKRP